LRTTPSLYYRLTPHTNSASSSGIAIERVHGRREEAPFASTVSVRLQAQTRLMAQNFLSSDRDQSMLLPPRPARLARRPPRLVRDRSTMSIPAGGTSTRPRRTHWLVHDRGEVASRKSAPRQGRSGLATPGLRAEEVARAGRRTPGDRIARLLSGIPRRSSSQSPARRRGTSGPHARRPPAPWPPAAVTAGGQAASRPVRTRA
jgi:hypothetical protein